MEQKAVPVEMDPSRVGLFVSGFWFSGSGAVVDWLRDHSAVIAPAGSEMKALGRGLYPLVEIAAGRRWYGEWSARSALFPERSAWSEVFGPSLLRGSLRQRVLGRTANAFHEGLSRIRTPSELGRLERKLRQLLRKDHREDRRYRALLGQAVSALREASGPGVFTDPRVRRSISCWLAHLHDVWATRDTVPVLNNAVSGVQADFVDLVDPAIFPHHVHIFVRRDPRDQLLEIAQNGPFNPRSPRFLRWFVRRYREDQERLRLLLGRWDRAGKKAVLVDFEDFVTDRAGVRDPLRSLVEGVLEDSGRTGRWHHRSFDPRRSVRNIGKWKEAGLQRPMTRLATGLKEHLHPLAD